jgi:hypothetical protein
MYMQQVKYNLFKNKDKHHLSNQAAANFWN